jgi:hypothetical protein
MKMAVFWVVAPCSWLKFTEGRQQAPLQPDYTAQQPRRQPLYAIFPTVIFTVETLRVPIKTVEFSNHKL